MVGFVRLFVTPWTIAHQAHLFMEFSRQEYLSGLPFLTPEHLPDPEIESQSPAAPDWQEDSLPLWHLGSKVISSVAQLCPNSLRPHGLPHARLPCPSPTPGACSNSCPSIRCCYPTVSSSVIPFFSRLQPFPASGSFPISQFFASGGQKTGVSALASVLQWIFRTDFL